MSACYECQNKPVEGSPTVCENQIKFHTIQTHNTRFMHENAMDMADIFQNTWADND